MFLDESLWAIRRTKWGRGVFARREVPAGTVIGDYLGVVGPPRDEPPGQLYAMMLSLYRWVYPPQPRRSVGVHVLNHSCEPNAGLFPYRGHVLLSATRRIFSGEEVTWDYWMSQPEPGEDWHPCLCGSAYCRGSFSMGSARQAELVRRLFVSDAWAGARRRVRVGEPFAPLPRYPAQTKDLVAYNVYGHRTKPPLTVREKTLRHGVLRALLRESGKRLYLPALRARVIGSHDGRLVVESLGA